MDTTTDPLLEEFLSYALPGDKYPSEIFYPAMHTRGGDMTIKEKAMRAVDSGDLIELEYSHGSSRKGVIVAYKRGGIEIKYPDDLSPHFPRYEAIADIRFVEPRAKTLTTDDIDALITENADLKSRNAELERSLCGPEQVGPICDMVTGCAVSPDCIGGLASCRHFEQKPPRDIASERWEWE